MFDESEDDCTLYPHESYTKNLIGIGFTKNQLLLLRRVIFAFCRASDFGAITAMF